MVALTVLSLAAGAHTFAGGQLPPAGIGLALLALTALAATSATRLKLNFPALASLLGAGQLVLHEAFTAFSGPAPGVSGPGGGLPPHHAGALPHSVSFSAQLAASGLDPQLPVVPLLSLLMLAGHALATLLCAVLLAGGEDALWALAAWLRPLLRLPAAVTPDAVAVPAPTGWPVESAPLPWRNLRRDCRRGPPAAVVIS